VTGAVAVWLAVQGVLFAVWAVAAFRTLLRLRARAVAESGRMFPGPGPTLQAFGAFLREPGFARDRRVLGGLGAVLLLASAGFALVSG
jgi:hypothetical protein